MKSELFVANASSFTKLKVVEDNFSIKLVSDEKLAIKILVHTAGVLALFLLLFIWDSSNNYVIFAKPSSIFFVCAAGLLATLAPNLLFVFDYVKYRDYIILYDKKNLLVKTKDCMPISIEKVEGFVIYSMTIGKPASQQVQVSYYNNNNDKPDRGLVYASAYSLSSGKLNEAFADFSRRIEKPLIVKLV